MPDLRSPEQRSRDALKRVEAEKDRRALATSYLRTFETEYGQRVLADLEREGKFLEPLFGLAAISRVDPIKLGALEGRRQLILYLRAMIEEGRKGEPQ